MTTEYEVEKGYSDPVIYQFSVFLENRVGVLRRFIERLEDTDIKIVGLTVLDTADTAVVRFVFDDADKARDVLGTSGVPFSETELLAVELPERGLLGILSALLQAEINVHYAYPMLRPAGCRPAVALHVDERAGAVRALRHRQYNLLDQSDVM